MENLYSPLPWHPLPAGADCVQPSDRLPHSVTLDSPATEVLTDLMRVFPESVEPDMTVEDANRLMIRRGIRLVLVVDRQRQIIGLLTASDILGEKPMQHIQRHGGEREGILVRDIMTPHEALQVIMIDDVARARVGDILATLKKAGRQHALVAQEAPTGHTKVRGIFSATQIARQLGAPVETTYAVPTTYTQMAFPT